VARLKEYGETGSAEVISAEVITRPCIECLDCACLHVGCTRRSWVNPNR